MERACPRCGFKRSRRPASAASRPEAAPTRTRDKHERSQGLVGAGLPAMQLQTKPSAGMRRIAARGRSHKNSRQTRAEPGFGGSGLARDAALNEARGTHEPYRGQRPLPQELTTNTSGARVWWERACPRCSFKRSPRCASAVSRPEAAPTKARDKHERSQGLVGAGLPAMQLRTKPSAGMRRIAARGRSHKNSRQTRAEPGFGGSGLARDAASNEAVGRHAPYRGQRPLPQELATNTSGARVWWERACPRCSFKRSLRPA